MKKREFWVQSGKFLCFSLSAGVIQMGSFSLLNELLRWSYWPSYLISLALCVFWNFTFNRRYTFKSANNIPKAMVLVCAYYVVFTPLSTLWGQAMADAKINEYVVLIFTMVVNFVTEFLYQRFFVFKNSIDTNALANKQRVAEQSLPKDETCDNDDAKFADSEQKNSNVN